MSKRESGKVKTEVLYPGDLLFGKGDRVLTTLLGSCVAITLWHPVTGHSGMCHITLPTRKRYTSQWNDRDKPDGRYADEAIELFDRLGRKNGLALREFDVRIYGGGNMLEYRKAPAVLQNQLESPQTAPVGEQNVRAVFELLSQRKIPVQEADVGEFGYRKVRFYTRTGDVRSQYYPGQ